MRRRPFDTSEIFEYKGYRFAVEISPDDHYGAPWEEADGHGVVSEWTSRDKAPGERILCSDRGNCRYYDVAESLKIARKDKWGCGFPEHTHKTARERAACAVDRDFEYLRAWCNAEWGYVVVGVTQVDDDDDPIGYPEYLGGVEDSDPKYLDEVACELADQIVDRLEVDTPDVVVSEN